MHKRIPEIIIKNNRNTLVRIPGKISNLYLLISPSNDVILIDAGFPSDILLGFKFLQDQFSLQPSNIKQIILSHLHLDHIAGTTIAAQNSQAKLAIGIWSKSFLSGEKIPMPPLKQWICELIPIWFKQGCPLPGIKDLKYSRIAGFPFINNHLEPPVSIWLDNHDNLQYVNNWEVLYLPGHTFDSIGLYNPVDGLLIAGDVILNYYGQGEFNNIVYDPNIMSKTVTFIQELDLSSILPGHGEPIIGKNITKQIIHKSQLLLCNS